jgi:REP element-mobilizing transposase RayT
VLTSKATAASWESKDGIADWCEPRTYGGRKKNVVGEHFWARGCYVSTAGKDEQAVGDYIKKQEKEEERLEQLSIFKED